MKLVVGTDLNVVKTFEDRIVAVNALDLSSDIEVSTCLDLYLDNVMANVPELALALHAKGFIRGIRMCSTEQIPYLTKSIIADSLLDGSMTSFLFKQANDFNFSSFFVL
jgi:hypothetical protein